MSVRTTKATMEKKDKQGKKPDRRVLFLLYVVGMVFVYVHTLEAFIWTLRRISHRDYRVNWRRGRNGTERTLFKKVLGFWITALFIFTT